MIISRIYAFDVLPERRADWIALGAQHAAECLANEPGTLEFRWFQDAANENRFLVFERYADQAAIEAHEADDSALARN